MYEEYLEANLTDSDSNLEDATDDDVSLGYPTIRRNVRAEMEAFSNMPMEFVDVKYVAEKPEPLIKRIKRDTLEKKSKKANYGWCARSFTSKNPTAPESTIPRPILSPIEYYMSYFQPDFFDKTAKYTNDYCMLKNGSDACVSAEEIKKYFGILLYMGLVRYPNLYMYWQHEFSHDMITKAMTRDRFHFIRNNIHVSSPAEHYDPENKLWRIQPFINMIQQKMDKIERMPDWCYSIDEQMIGFTGKCPRETKQTIKNKPRPTGFRNYCLCTSKGLMLKFIIYQGKSTKLDRSVSGVGASVIVTLSAGLPDNSFIFFDRFFTSIPLLRYLLGKKINATGTIMSNRLGPAPFQRKASQMQRGDIEEYVDRDGEVVLVRWKDSRDVLLASNCIGASPTGTIERREKNSSSKTKIAAPACVLMYNNKMGGVDIIDQELEYYRCYYKTPKWTVKLMTHLIELICCNSYMEMQEDFKLANITDKEYNTFLKFRKSVAISLINGYWVERNVQTALEEAEQIRNDTLPTKRVKKPEKIFRYDMTNHYPKVEKVKDAQRCRMEKCKGKTRILCLKCRVFLCLTAERNCFYNFHNPVEAINED